MLVVLRMGVSKGEGKSKSPPWASLHRDLSGFGRIFFPTAAPSSWKYIQYSCVLWHCRDQKSFVQNCLALQNEGFLLQDKEKCHGKAAAYHGTLTLYLYKKIRFEAGMSLWRLALCSFILSVNTESILRMRYLIK